MEKSWPKDAIGNQIKKGKLIHLTLPQNSALFHVINVEPGGLIASPGGKPMQVKGKVSVVLQFDLEYMPDSRMGDVLVLEQPDESALSVASPEQTARILKQ